MNSFFEFVYRLGRLISEAAQVLRSPYVRELESQNHYLRAENAALRDSLLGTAGVLPVEPRIQARLNSVPNIKTSEAGQKPVRRLSVSQWLRRQEERDAAESRQIAREWREAQATKDRAGSEGSNG